MTDIFENAQKLFQFFETPTEHSKFIFNNYNPSCSKKVIDICCGLGSLIEPWYNDTNNKHDITLAELNTDFIPILKMKFPKANIISTDYLKTKPTTEYDVYLCNPPFKINGEYIYKKFFCKILMNMRNSDVLYFICPRKFYNLQQDVKIEWEPEGKIELIQYMKETGQMHPKFYFDKYGCIDLYSSEFNFSRKLINTMLDEKIIDDYFFMEYEKGIFSINPYYQFEYIRNVFDFEKTKCQCGIFKVSR